MTLEPAARRASSAAPAAAAPAPHGAWSRISSRAPGKWAFWRFNWVVNHEVIRALERVRVHAHGTLLDIGCGDMRSARWFRGHVDRYLGIDLHASRFMIGRRPTAFARAEALPFRDGSLDTVLGVSMLTYLPEPERMLEEAHRVLRPGGTLLLEFTQTAPLHDEPFDFFRFTRYGARALLDRTGFEVIEIVPIGTLWTTVAMSAIAALNRLNRGPWRVLTELPVRVLYVVVQLGGAALGRMFGNPREPVGHMIAARRRERIAAPGAPRMPFPDALAASTGDGHRDR